MTNSFLRALLLFSLAAACSPSPEPDDSEFRRAREARQEQQAETVEVPAQPSADRAEGEGQPTAQPAEAPAIPPGLLSPSEEEQAPATYTAELQTTEGPIVIDVTRSWSPNGADRFYNLVKLGYFTDVAFFRVLEGFMAQAGMHGDPRVNRVWSSRNIPDDPVTQQNTRGMVTFAKTNAPNSRANQFFINYGDNRNLDPMGFAPFGRVRDMTAVDALHSGYGEGAPRGRGPSQGDVARMGNRYLKASFPELDYIESARILEENGQPVSADGSADDSAG